MAPDIREQDVPRAGRVISAARIRLVVVCCLYAACLTAAYVGLVTPVYGSWGLGWDEQLSLGNWCLIAVLGILPAFFLELTLRRPSSVFLLIQYLLIYLPTLLVAFHGISPGLSPERARSLCLLLASSFLGMLCWQRLVPLIRLPRPRVREHAYWLAMAGLGLFCAGYIALVLGGNFRWVGLEGIAEVRDDASDLIAASGSAFGGYAYSWVCAAFVPAGYAAAVLGGRYKLAGLVLLCYIPLYGIWGSKTALIAPLVLMGLTLLSRARPRNVVPTMALGLAAILMFPLILSDEGAGAVARQGVLGLYHFRTVFVQALLLTQYFDYFDAHAWTYGSHISGINMLVHYPYDGDLPRVLGAYYYGYFITANTGFWGQDGMAGFGALGIPVISLVVALIFWLLDSCSRDLKPRYVVISLGVVLVAFTNTSVFTTLITGGLLLLALMYYLAPASMREVSR